MTKEFSFQIGDCVLVRKYRKSSTFDPYFSPEKFCVDILANENTWLIENTVIGLCLQRHPNDIKVLSSSLLSLSEQDCKNDNITYDENLHWKNAFDFVAKSEHSDNDESFQKTNPTQTPLRGSIRLRRPNPKFFKDYFELWLQS